MSRATRISACLEALGFECIEEWFEQGASLGGPLDSVMIGACESCGELAESCEPDAYENACDYCESNGVESLAVMAGII